MVAKTKPFQIVRRYRKGDEVIELTIVVSAIKKKKRRSVKHKRRALPFGD